jgi:tRNA(Ile)-lysidine synthase TilS/MesJ
MKTEKFSAENKWQQTQFNEKDGEIWKKEIKKYCKYNNLKYKDKVHCSTYEKYIKISVENSKNGLSYMHNMSVHFDN